MNAKRLVKALAILAVGILSIAVVWIFLIWNAFIRIPDSTPAPFSSPDGSKLLVATINHSKADMRKYLCVHLEVQDARTGRTLYQVQTGASVRMSWSLHWLSNDTFQLDSSDIGSYCWTEEAGAWRESQCPPQS